MEYVGKEFVRHEFRLEKEKPVLEAFCKRLDEQKPTKGTRHAKAVNYAQNRKDTLMTCLENGHCSLSNNLSENAIRLFTVGRKNWLFSASPKGATVSAMVYTMVEMAKANDLGLLLLWLAHLFGAATPVIGFKNALFSFKSHVHILCYHRFKVSGDTKRNPNTL